MISTAFLATCEPVSAMSLLEDVPVPTPRPTLNRSFVAEEASPSYETTSSIPRAANPAAVSPKLKAGLDALKADQIDKARATRDSLPRGSLDNHILTWAIAVSGAKGVPSADIAAASRELQGWPGLNSLRGNSEEALYEEYRDRKATARQVIAAFGNSTPETVDGSIALARALQATGDSKKAASVIARLWRTKALDRSTENLVKSEFSGLLTQADHKRRMDMLLYRDRVSQAERVEDLAKAQSLFKARAGLSQRSGNTGKLLDAVHSSWHGDPLYIHARAKYYRQADKYETAATWLLKAPRNADALVDTHEWWTEQRIVSRSLAEKGDYRLAYKVASHHMATDAGDFVDAEWHAGWYALRGLNDGKTAARHFQAGLDRSATPLSRSRFFYWLGRAAEKGGPGSANALFAKAAEYPGTYYGQLASAKLNRKSIRIDYPSPTPAERQRFSQRESVLAIKRLNDAGHGYRATRLYLALAEELDSPGEIALLTAMAEREGDHRMSLLVGKAAFARNSDVAALAFPVGVIPANANIGGSGKALAYAIARQESAFDPAAVSGANARGLLQLLPSTAKLVARKHGLSYSESRLTTDAAYNATLGAHYLGEHISDFNGSYILTFVAYNAGPRRSTEWIERFGDPRGKSIDEVVDWVESIPYPETRNYVQRVMENYQVYKTRLGQDADIVSDLRYGRR